MKFGNKSQMRIYAKALRQQAIIDYVTALVLRKRQDDSVREWKEGTTTIFHAVIAKLQQAEEKLIKGYLLYEMTESFNPMEGHCLLSEDAGNRKRNKPDFRRTQKYVRFIVHLKNADTQGNISTLKELENLAPKGPDGCRKIDDVIIEVYANTEYPFFLKGNDPACPALRFDEIEVSKYLKALDWLVNKLSLIEQDSSTRNEYTSDLQGLFRWAKKDL